MPTRRPRRVLRLSGQDARDFLQSIVTNDVAGLDRGAVYAALLTPQGKYLADFFLIPEADSGAILIDLPEPLADDVTRRLKMYMLRAKARLEATDLGVERGLGPVPEGAFADPRSPELGWRRYGDVIEDPEVTARIEALRMALGVPEAGAELIPGDTYILEAGFERLNGVNFRKGCYVGQEIVARMKHKTELRKGIVRVRVDGQVPEGTEVERDGRAVGTLYSQWQGNGLALLRFDRIGPGMTAAGVSVEPAEA